MSAYYKTPNCGYNFQQHHCKAVCYQRCFCQLHGYYNNPSVQRNIKPNVDQNISNAAISTRNKPAQHKSAKKRQRDIQRLLEFRARKTACAMMPFYNLPNDELQNCLPNNQSLRQLNALEKENRMLKLVNEELSNCVLLVQKEQQYAERDAYIAQFQLDKCKTELNSLTEKLHSYDQSLLQQENLQKEISEVKAQNLKLNSNISEDKKTILKLSEQKQTLYKFFVDTLQLLSEFNSIKDGLKYEYKALVNQLYHGCKDFKPHNVKEFKCKRCGSSNYHHRSQCLANNNKCSKCNKQNHFTSMCNTPEKHLLLRMPMRFILMEMERETGVSALDIIDENS